MSCWKKLGGEPGELAEECCFLCKGGGDHLRACDYFENCLKAYHPCCLENKHGFFPTQEEQFVCDWHICFNCKQSSQFQCLCCPISVCRDCIGKVGFVELRKQQKGFCTSCLNKAISIEKNTDSDPRWVQSDYSNAEISDILFKDYWEDVKDTEHVKLVYLEEARVILNRKLDCNRANSDKFPDEDHKSAVNMFAENAAIDKTIPLDSKKKQNKVTSLKKNKSKKKTYIGWGSKELIQFLSSFGKDTSKSLDEVEIVEVIMGHIKENDLFNDNKKKSFWCDDKLQPLFGRRKVRCRGIRKFIAVHLAETNVSEDENSDGSVDDVSIAKNKPYFDGSEDDDVRHRKKKPRDSLDLKIAMRVSERNKRCFASLNEKNINLIYMRKSLVINLLNHPDTFDEKVVGCFVRVKNGPRVHIYEMPKKPHQLGLVTGKEGLISSVLILDGLLFSFEFVEHARDVYIGIISLTSSWNMSGIKKSSEEYKINGICTNILLCVTGLWDDVRISMLSDEDFAEEECNDLVSLVNKGFLERPTIATLEEKVATVHKDIVNHWIDKELLRLEREIDRAHIKGWREYFEELMHTKNKLSTEAERIRRLEEVPEIIADTEQEGNETEDEVAASNSSQENRVTVKDSAYCFMDGPENSTGNANASLPPLSFGAKQRVANNLNYQDNPPKDGSSTEAVDIDKDESECSRRKNSRANIEAINLDSDEDEDLHIVEHRTEGNASHALRSMNGGHLHLEQSKLASLIPLHALGVMNEDLHLEKHEAPMHAAMNAVSPLTPCGII